MPMIFRIRHILLACVASFCPADVFARGGPAAVLGFIVEFLIVLAIIVALISGVLCAKYLRNLPWKALVIFLAIASGFSVAFPVFGILFGIPAVVLLAVFLSVYSLMQGRSRQLPGEGSVLMTPENEKRGREASGASGVMRWMAAAYVTGVAVSLMNFDLLGFLVLPPMVFFFPRGIGRFLPFILPPLAAALVIGAIVTVIVVKRFHATQHASPLIFNVCVAFAFFGSAEIYGHHLMVDSLMGHNPSRLHESSFLSSVLTYQTHFRGPHASFEENGKAYLWSYSERKFVDVR